MIEVEFVDSSGNRGVFAVAEIISIDGKAYVSDEHRMELRDRMTYTEARLDTIENTLLAAMRPEQPENEGE